MPRHDNHQPLTAYQPGDAVLVVPNDYRRQLELVPAQVEEIYPAPLAVGVIREDGIYQTVSRPDLIAPAATTLETRAPARARERRGADHGR